MAVASSRMASEHFFFFAQLRDGVIQGKILSRFCPVWGLGLRKILEISPLWTFSGDGRSRTAVQTSHQIAFYTFIHPLIVGSGLPNGGLTGAYPLSLGGV